MIPQSNAEPRADFTNEELDDIDRVALAATQGTWVNYSGAIKVEETGFRITDVRAAVSGNEAIQASNAAHIARASPAVVQKLVALARRGLAAPNGDTTHSQSELPPAVKVWLEAEVASRTAAREYQALQGADKRGDWIVSTGGAGKRMEAARAEAAKALFAMFTALTEPVAH